ncbi:MAG: glycosyltransferase family 4 protein [Acidobacteriota bacterium]|nr:glycosyltransferase family 4 protein [Acidobacteriota bacterium]
MVIKVCILTSVHPPFDTRIFHKEAKSLAKAGYDVTLIAQHDKGEIVDKIRIVPLSKPKNRLERMTRTAWSVYRKALKIDADIYHFHDPELMPIGLLLKWHGKRVIYDVHEDVPRQNLSKDYIPVAFRKPISWLIGALEAFSARRFDGVVTATPFINKRFLELGANAANVNNCPIVSELYAAGNHWKNKEKAVCYVGGIAQIRGAFEMVEAIGKTKYRLLLAGNIESAIETSLKQVQGWRQAETLGFVNREGVRAMMVRSMAGLVLFHPEPNHIDAQPNKMFEYMSAGIPVIASGFPLWREIIEGAECGLCVDPLDTEEIAEAIQFIIEHPAEAKQMGKNGRRAVEERYNWGIEEDKLLGFYRVLAHAKPQRR